MERPKDTKHVLSVRQAPFKEKSAIDTDFVLEKSIFSNIFEKDIKRVYIYKKAERLAKAIHLIAPAFRDSMSLRNKMDSIAIALVDAATLPPGVSRTNLSRELLALSSVLSMARTGGMLSPMNAELIGSEAHRLLQEVAAYEEPRLFLDDALSLADVARLAGKHEATPDHVQPKTRRAPTAQSSKGHLKDTQVVKDTNGTERQDAILSVLRMRKEGASIKAVSSVIRDVSEKTIQRELQTLIEQGVVRKVGERRWSTYYMV